VLQSPNNKKLGNIAENYAADLLKSQGYKIIDRNFRSRFGELDIIAAGRDSLIFVEVKARWSDKFGNPEEAVTYSKLNKIKKTIDFYFLKHPSVLTNFKIEVIALEMDGIKPIKSKIIVLD
jgi:putative endonuclease